MKIHLLQDARFVFLVAVALATATTACGSPVVKRQAAMSVLTEADAGVIRRVALGAVFQVRLQAQPGTGYSWEATTDGGIAQQGAVVSVNGNGIPGGFETRVFTFRARETGRHPLYFRYIQPWVGGAKDGKALVYTIDIR